MFLLDTNVLGELRKVSTGNADPNVKLWANSIRLRQASLSVVTVFEARRGVVLLTRRDPAQAQILDHWLTVCLKQKFAGRIHPVTEAIALRCAELPVATPEDLPDALIAATALVHGLTVVTRNTRHFTRTGARFMNPWE